VRDATRMLLRVEGFEVSAVSNIAEALQAVKAHPAIGLLVTDFHLAAGETGVQVLEAVRQQLRRRVPAVLVTGDTSTAMRELSCDNHLRTASKPINPDELLALMRELIQD